MDAEKYGTKWSEEETILAFCYYCQIPFGKIHKNNPEIKRIAAILGRTPSSVSRKMGNLAHFDPELQKRNIKGLSNASKTDAEIVERFYKNWEELTYRAAEIESSLTGITISKENDLPPGSTVDRTVKARVNQQFFRDSVLSSYNHHCCITGIDIPGLLVASHIKPWAVSDPETERTNPSNGLCLNALHDKAFDKGLITILPDYSIQVSHILLDHRDNDEMRWLLRSNGEKINLPERFIPKRDFLEYHNDVIFIP